MAKIKVRARAVDMLGRQQIAGIPTAIHELFKNAHDAYAQRVRVDYIHGLDLFMLRDNGLGMTKSDLETKWLTLGTESKVGKNDPGSSVWTGPENFSRRASLGEKGIGRLAIAAIGPQVLVYSRAVKPDGAHKPVCALVNWSLFEQPGLDLDQIDIPIIELNDHDLINKGDIEDLVKSAITNVEIIGENISAQSRERIVRELEMFPFDPQTVYEALGDPTLGKPYGTHFLIRPSSLELSLDLKLNQNINKGASSLQRYLLGFGNTMHGDDSAPPIIAEFVEHRSDGSSEDLIGPLAFFTPEEFDAADHHIHGRFDEHGTFRGQVRIYDQVEHEYTLSPAEDIVGKTECGPFEVSFAYVQGLAKDTRMQLDEWKLLGDKLESIGGLYIYRDGIRILPYGNSDVDWLNIERRRTLSASDWFFSYRRLIGDVRLSHQNNPNLVEKAGREGFRQNKAYRQMVSLLERLFQRLAQDFFREKARISTDFDAIRKNKQRDHEILQKRAKSVKNAKNTFNVALLKFFEEARAGEFELACGKLLALYTSRLTSVSTTANPVVAGDLLLQVENDFQNAIKNLKDKISIARPRNFGLTKQQQQDFEAYLRERERLLTDHFDPMVTKISNTVRELYSDGTTDVDPRKRLNEPIERESEVALSSASDARRKVTSTLDEIEKEVRSTVSKTWADLNNQVEVVKADLSRTEVASLSPEEIERRRDKLVDQLRSTAERSTHLMDVVGERLRSVLGSSPDQPNMLDVANALESENDELKERVNQYADLAQIGLALGLVQHEFSGQVRNINRGLDALKPWAGRNQGLDDLYKRLRISFEHLESYLQLFVPLNRRLHRRRLPVSGAEIEEFTRTVFGPRFERHGVELRVPNDFKVSTVTTFPSTLLPVFANVVDNAVHWLGERRDQPKVITFGITAVGLTISNSGPGIDPRDAAGIFEFGMSNKPAGRGMGLYLSRDALRKEGMDITLERPGKDITPTFIITVPEDMMNRKEEF